MTDETAALWAAVDRLTKPTTVHIARASDDDWIADLRDQHDGYCYLDAYRAATSSHGTIPSLWDQAVTALTGGEIGGTGAKPLRERSPADLDLMEIMALIRDTTRRELAILGVRTERTKAGEFVPFQPAEIRRLASQIIRAVPDDMWWFEYRFTQWGRLLETYLHAAEHAPKPTRLRNTPCPLCKTRQTVVEQDGENMVVPPLVVDYREGYVRAARCDACGATWFRGAELEELARLVDAPGGEMLTA